MLEMLCSEEEMLLVSCDKKLSAILYAFESTNLVQFEIIDNRVFVKQRQH